MNLFWCECGCIPQQEITKYNTTRKEPFEERFLKTYGDVKEVGVIRYNVDIIHELDIM